MNAKLMPTALLVMFACLLTGCAKLPDDGANAQSKRYKDVNRVRYIEIFVVGGNGITGNLVANVYNTPFQLGFDPKVNKDSAPQAWVEGLNTEEIKKRFSALSISINGPKLWMLDWIDISLGREREFEGKNIPWCVAPQVIDDFREGKAGVHSRRPRRHTVGDAGVLDVRRFHRKLRDAERPRLQAEASWGLEVPCARSRQGADHLDAAGIQLDYSGQPPEHLRCVQGGGLQL